MIPALLVGAVWLYWRGHHLPGGGFAGGLVAVAAFALAVLSFGPNVVAAAVRWDPRTLMASGLAVALASGCLAVLRAQPFMQASWTALPIVGKLGTPLLFDLGVFLVVSGFGLTLLRQIAED
jgi:multicomponent Na+:H+ antiporter subunit B